MIVLMRLEGPDDDTYSFIEIENEIELNFLERLRKQFSLDSVYEAQPVLSYVIIDDEDYKKYLMALSWEKENWNDWCEKKKSFYVAYHSVLNLFYKSKKKFLTRR